jgi:hypothetical protein
LRAIDARSTYKSEAARRINLSMDVRLAEMPENRVDSQHRASEHQGFESMPSILEQHGDHGRRVEKHEEA